MPPCSTHSIQSDKLLRVVSLAKMIFGIYLPECYFVKTFKCQGARSTFVNFVNLKLRLAGKPIILNKMVSFKMRNNGF